MNIPKIEKNYLDTISKEENVLNYFGNWICNIEKHKASFLIAQPFEHVVIDNFLEEVYAEKISNLFPVIDSNWHGYKNPVEVKYAYDNINELSIDLKNYFYYLSSPKIINIIRNITDISNLEYDEYLHGAGLHSHSRYGRLNIHLDYEKHPITGKERRINIILFMTKNWNTNWNGANELWDKDVTKCITKTEIKFNRAIIFKTNDISWHGLPEKIMCPENIFRKSLAYYYVSPLNTEKSEKDYRKKAKFIKRPEDPFDENIQKLYEIRPQRLITKEDMEKIMPDWSVEM
jgi:Rps23 Pro-64 3,4-dihydroxylase Tpa1-like proline 4-hydroxylase